MNAREVFPQVQYLITIAELKLSIKNTLLESGFLVFLVQMVLDVTAWHNFCFNIKDYIFYKLIFRFAQATGRKWLKLI
jgi:hypothetical protein